MDPNEFLNRILATLGVKDEAAALQAITTGNHIIASLQGICAVSDPDEIVSAVKSKVSICAQLQELTGVEGQAALGAVAGFKAEAAKVPGLQSKVAEKEQADRSARVKAMLDKANREGKVNLLLEVPGLQAKHEKSDEEADWLEAHLAVRSPIVATRATKLEPSASANAAAPLTAEERRACKATGTTPEEFLAEKKLLAEERASRAPADSDDDQG